MKREIIAIVATLAIMASSHVLPLPIIRAQPVPEAWNITKVPTSADPDLDFLAAALSRGPLDKDITLLPRPASDEQWNKAVCKGAMLNAGMSGSDKAAGQLLDPPQDSVASKFVNWPGEFIKWYYHMMDVDRAGVGNFDFPWNVGDALRALGVSASRDIDGGKNTILGVSHYNRDAKDDKGVPIQIRDQTYQVILNDGKVHELPATGAKMMFSFNPFDGVIMAMDRSGPADSVRRLGLTHVTPDLYPALQRSSDISWGLWNRVAGNNIKNIKYYFSLHITNRPTLQLISRALTKGELKKWPGEKIEFGDERLKALIGAPNSVSIAYFLMQHKKELGNMYIKAATIFGCTPTYLIACLLLEVAELK